MAVHHRGYPWTPPPQTKVAIVGKKEIFNRENLVGPLLVHKLLGPRPPPIRLPTSFRSVKPLGFKGITQEVVGKVEDIGVLRARTGAWKRARVRGQWDIVQKCPVRGWFSGI